MRNLVDTNYAINENIERINSLQPGSDDMARAEHKLEELLRRYETQAYAGLRAARRGQLGVT